MTTEAAVLDTGGARRRILAHPWARFIVRRLGQFVIALFLLVTGVFGMVHAIPGDPVRNALGANAAPSIVAAKRHMLGLDQSLWHQYLTYLDDVVHARFGNSLITGLSVKNMLGQQLPATISLAVSAFVVAVLVSIPLGMVIGVLTRDGRRRGVDVGFGATTGILSVLPDFVLGVILQFLFAVTLKALPVAGQGGFSSYVLPVLALATWPAALLMRIVRVETQRVLNQEYMRTARAKRLPWRLEYLRHALPNLLTSTLTISGLILASLLAGTVLIEKIFAWPGVGAQLVSSTLAKDFPVVQALGLFFGVSVLLINLSVDVVIAVINPQSTIKEG
ncbi:MAG TPA: ABC transporter permease [Pseudonocardiaceae bacterium]|nr:ABC transporter permease [Pseudonocardiaceae bacterium]